LRVFLRAPHASDRDEFLAAVRSSARLHRPWVTPPGSPEGFARLLARVGDERSEPVLVCRREDGAIVGWFNISEIVRGPLQSGFLGYGAVAAHAGRGYMSEGLQLLLAHAFEELRLHRLEANIQPGNAPSIRLVQRAGFVREGFSERYLKVAGRWRDHERWAIRAEQWRALRRSGTRAR
jgi:[ribosomal protein S5]-alanine N-acetyltransferase